MKRRLLIALFASLVLTGGGVADDLLGNPRGGSGGSSGGSSGGGSGGAGPKPETPPKPATPPKRDDDRTPPRREEAPPRAAGGGSEPSRVPIHVESRPTPVRQGRSGTVDYRTQNNVTDLSRRRDPIRVESAPAPRATRSSLEGMVRREENVRTTTYRAGYVHYDSRWRDDDFCYPYYDFRYDSRRSVVSPWYSYPHLPPYLDQRRVTFIFDWPTWDCPDRYDWSYRDRYDSRSSTFAVDSAIADIVRGFTRRDLRAIGRLVPRRETVWVSAENGERYRLGSDDFYDMVVDMIEQTRTRDYEVVEVRRGRSDVRVMARHEFEDTWGRRCAVYHEYTLQWDGRDYSIVQFGTIRARAW